MGLFKTVDLVLESLAMEFLTEEDDPEQCPGVLQTVRMETEAMPPLVELGRKLLGKAQEGDTEAVRELMSQGAPFTTDWLGTSPIHWACQLNHYDTAVLLLKAGISRDARNKVERTPLHVTATEGHVRILKLLLQHGVDVDALDMLSMAPLHWAAEYGHDECVRLLLEHGADPTAVNKFGLSADLIAFNNNRLDITHMIQEYAENPMLKLKRAEAKEKQKQAALAHKATVDRERALLVKHHTFRVCADKPGEVKTPKFQKCKPRIIHENNKFDDNEVVTLPTSTAKTMAVLQSHGITLLPKDESSIVESAIESGRKIVVTEAGKRALTLTQSCVMKPQMPLPVKNLMRVPPDLVRTLPGGKKVISIPADQLINMKNKHKFMIQTIKPQNKLTCDTSSPTKTKVDVVVTKKVMNNNKAPLTPSVVLKSTELKPVPSVTLVPHVIQPKDVTAIGDLSEVQKLKLELEEAKQELNLLRIQYLRKEKEAEEYKKMLGHVKSK